MLRSLGIAMAQAVVAMSSEPRCDSIVDARRVYLGAGADNCFPGSVHAEELRAYRRAQLECTQRLWDGRGSHTDPMIGLMDNVYHREYDPTCCLIEGSGRPYLALLAEPYNALTSLRAYDHIACAEGAEHLHIAGAYMGWASFMYHAGGGGDYTDNSTFGEYGTAMDDSAMICLVLRILHKARARRRALPVRRRPGHAGVPRTHSRTPNPQASNATRTSRTVDLDYEDGRSFDVSELAESCVSLPMEVLDRDA